MTRNVRGGIAGAVAATLWTALDPVLERTFRTPYADAKLLGTVGLDEPPGDGNQGSTPIGKRSSTSDTGGPDPT